MWNRWVYTSWIRNRSLLLVLQVRGVVECAGGLKLTLKDGKEVQNLLVFDLQIKIYNKSFFEGGG